MEAPKHHPQYPHMGAPYRSYMLPPHVSVPLSGLPILMGLHIKIDLSRTLLRWKILLLSI
jgi:hypothetical protein